MNEKDSGLLVQLRKDPDKTLVILYREHRSAFFSWARKVFGANEDDASDCFQDAVIVFYNNVKEGKITTLESSIKTYLFSIGKKLLLTRFRYTQRMTNIDNITFTDQQQAQFELPELYEGSALENRIAEIVRNLKEPCRSILRYFYFRGFDMSEIAETMNYKNAQTVKSQKVRCIKELRQMLQKFMN